MAGPSRRSPTDPPPGAGTIQVWSEEDWSSYLEERFGFPVRVRYGRSRTAPVQARAARLPRAGAPASPDPTVGWELRLHRRFAEAPRDVRDALAKWLRAGRRARRAGPVLDAWIHSEIASLAPAPRRIALYPIGLTYDLRTLAARAFETEFAVDFEPKTDRTRPHITWGRRALSRSRRSLRLGSYEPTSRVVRIHPVLDQPGVPEWFVAFVLKHEILHAVLDAYRDEHGRWVHHGEAFRAREASWPEHGPALAWEQRNLSRLIRSAREGSALRVRREDVAPLAEAGGGDDAEPVKPQGQAQGQAQARPRQLRLF